WGSPAGPGGPRGGGGGRGFRDRDVHPLLEPSWAGTVRVVPDRPRDRGVHHLGFARRGGAGSAAGGGQGAGGGWAATSSGPAHGGIAVRSLDEAVARWTESLGFRHVDTITLDSMGLRIAFLERGGTELEPLEPMRSDSTVATFLAKRGEGIHHLSFYVPDIE